MSMLAAMLASGKASAQATVRWHQISFGDPAISLDTMSLAKSPDGFPRATLVLTYRKPRGGGLKEIARILDVADFDCPHRQQRKVQVTSFDAEGEVADSVPRREMGSQWLKVTVGTDDEVELSAFCRTIFAQR